VSRTSHTNAKNDRISIRNERVMSNHHILIGERNADCVT